MAVRLYFENLFQRGPSLCGILELGRSVFYGEGVKDD